MRTISQRGHMYDIDLEQVGSCVFIAFLTVRTERNRLNDPLVKVEVTAAEHRNLKERINEMGALHLPDSDWRFDSLCGIPVEVIGDPLVSPSV